MEQLPTESDAFSSNIRWWSSKPGDIYIAGLLFLASVLLLRRQLAKRKSVPRLPPGPKAWPIIGNIHQLTKQPAHQALHTLSQKYGPLMLLRLGRVQTVVASSPDMAKEVLQTQDQVFASRPRNLIGEVYNYDHQGLIFAPLGERLRNLRKACTVELFSAKKLGEFQDVRREEMDNSLQTLLTASREGRLVDISHEVNPLFYNNITRLLFGKRFYGSDTTIDYADQSRQAERFKEILMGIGSTGFFVIGEFIPWLRWMDLGGTEAKLKHLKEELDGLLSEVVEEHRRKGKNTIGRQDFVHVLLGLQKDPSLALTDIQVKAFLQDLLAAGVDTGTTHVMWTLSELMRHPEVMLKLQSEIDAVVGKDRLVEESDLVHLTYLHSVIKESFRIHPVVPLLVPHESVKATTIAGYDIPDKTRVFVNTYAIGRDPETWENPLEFNPDRFLNRSVDLRGQSFELVPFGSGRRSCVGLNLGLILVESTIASWIHALDFSLPAGVKPTDLDMEETMGVTVARKSPLNLQVQPRLSAQAYEELKIIL